MPEGLYVQSWFLTRLWPHLQVVDALRTSKDIRIVQDFRFLTANANGYRGNTLSRLAYSVTFPRLAGFLTIDSVSVGWQFCLFFSMAVAWSYPTFCVRNHGNQGILQKGYLPFTQQYFVIITCDIEKLLPVCTISSRPLEMPAFHSGPAPFHWSELLRFYIFRTSLSGQSVRLCTSVPARSGTTYTSGSLGCQSSQATPPLGLRGRWLDDDGDICFLFLFFLERCNTPPFCLFNISLIWQ